MQLLKSKLQILAVFCFILTGCANQIMSYRLDPEIRSSEALASKVQSIAINVIDDRQKSIKSPVEGTTSISGPTNEANVLREKLIDNLKQANFKITSNQLLADLAMEIHIEKLDNEVVKTFLKSTIKVESHLRLIANKQSNTLEKLYKRSAEQEVANPVNELDITGVVNQVLSSQLSEMFADEMLIKLAAKQNEQEAIFD